MKARVLVSLLLLSSTINAGFDFGECQGSGTFEQQIVQYAGDYERTTIVGEIPAGIQGLKIYLISEKDVDIRLYGENSDKIVHWPKGILNGSSLKTKLYKDVNITYSGFNGVNKKKGHEFIEITGSTPTSMTMKAFGYKAGYATVNYSWMGKDGCTSKPNGKGSFVQNIIKNSTKLVGTIPPNVKEVFINLSSNEDLDIQLYGVDTTAIVSWKPKGLLSGAMEQNISYHNMNITWSGYNGVDQKKGHEYIKISGTTTEMLVMKVYGYKAGSANVNYTWGSVDTTAPMLTLKGDSNITLILGQTYTELGATATDNVDTNISVDIQGSVDTSKVGIYTITYSATDKAGNVATSITRTVEVKQNLITLTGIEINKSDIELSEGNQTTLSVSAIYDNNTSKNVTTNVVWQIANSSIVSIDNNGSLLGLKEGNTTLQAKYEGKVSNAVTVVVYKEINGYRLPPEPNPSVNNATLLGVDSNDNGIRDDVERKIIIKYQKPIEIELMFSYAKIDQEILSYPLSEALELERKTSRVGDCQMYLRRQGIKIKDAIGDSENFTYNIKTRAKKYINFNKELNSAMYGSDTSNYKAEACDFDVEQMLKDRK